MPNTSTARIDKWLWAVRLFKTRSLATDACRAGSVEVNGRAVKPSHDVQAGERIRVRQGLVLRSLVVKAIPASRLGAPLVPQYCEDQTPPEEYARAREQRVQHLLAREQGSGRPTKRERRQWEQWLG